MRTRRAASVCGPALLLTALVIGGASAAHAEPLPCIDDFLPPNAKTGLCPAPSQSPTATNAPPATTTTAQPTPTTVAPTTTAPTTPQSRPSEPSTVTFEIYAGRSGVTVDEVDIDTLGKTFGKTQLPFAQTVSLPSPVTSLRMRAYGNGQDKIGCRITVNGTRVVDVMNSAVAICTWAP